MTDLIEYTDGVLVEIARNDDPARAVSGRGAERVEEAFKAAVETAATCLRGVIDPLSHALTGSGAKEVQIELGLSFSIEGNVFVTKASGEGNIVVRITIGGHQKTSTQ